MLLYLQENACLEHISILIHILLFFKDKSSTFFDICAFMSTCFFFLYFFGLHKISVTLEILSKSDKSTKLTKKQNF